MDVSRSKRSTGAACDYERKIRFDDDLSKYEGFFESSFAERVDFLVRGTRYEVPAFDLCSTWKGLSCARRLPWLLVTGLKDTIKTSATEPGRPFPVKVVNALAERLIEAGSVGGIELPINLKGRLVSETRAIERELAKTVRATPDPISIETIWRAYLGEYEFTMGLWASETSAFCALYFAYEDLLVRSFKIALRRQKLRTETFGELFKRLGIAAGDGRLGDFCWSGKSVEIPRLIRHAVVHNGGRITPQLQRYRNDIGLEGEQIVIMAHLTTRLYNVLKERVVRFMAAVRTWNPGPLEPPSGGS